MKRRTFIAGSAAGVAGTVLSTAAPASAGIPAGGSTFTLQSSGLDAQWSLDGGTFRMVGLFDRFARQTLPLPREVFSLHFADGTVRAASQFVPVAGPLVERRAGTPASARMADRVASTAVTLQLRDRSSGTLATWRAIAVTGACYLRWELTLAAEGAPLALREVRLVDWPRLPGAETVGLCDGSPIVAGRAFAAVEHPFAQVDAIYDRAIAYFPNKVDVAPGVPLVVSAVIGTTRPGQLRRDFLSYVELERAHPYRTFLHYNSWYDIGYFTRYGQDECLSRIDALGKRLSVERNVVLSSFLFDDGWDDPNDLWSFNAGFPDGFAPLRDAAARYGARTGAWLSPWGGYGEPRAERLASAKRYGYEIDDDGLALSGPKYYERFHSVVMNFIERGGVNQFKLDGTGSSQTVYPHSRFGNNFEAAIALIADMRAAEPDIYVNLTTGTYPSPFWLRYCDSIWRGGNDHDFTGAGTRRQRWITYRDADTYDGIVTQGPLFPLNSLMLHGLIYAQHAFDLHDDPAGDFRDEVRSYFGSGTQLQELYVTPSLLSASNWDDIASAAKWSRRNANVLRDTHWVGGNPARLDAYGWASWSPAKALLALRNPSDRTQSLPVDIGRAFELPDGAPVAYTVQAHRGSGRVQSFELRAGREHLFTLDPFEVLVVQAWPKGAVPS